ncbi:vacuolar ATPase assembly integral membrane protein VMA21 [Geopyxis carbonaria]|nr:vacuolar ATPase assembly integral membrane protein VMA21 [Geopyxis carbonaria]
MATRRTVKIEKDSIDEGRNSQAATSTTSSAAPVVPGSVIAKLLLFTLAMIAGPLATYYVSVSFLFKDNSTVAAALAAVAANAVLISYVIVAMREDDPDGEKEKKAL